MTEFDRNDAITDLKAEWEATQKAVHDGIAHMDELHARIMRLHIVNRLIQETEDAMEESK